MHFVSWLMVTVISLCQTMVPQTCLQWRCMSSAMRWGCLTPPTSPPSWGRTTRDQWETSDTTRCPEMTSWGYRHCMVHIHILEWRQALTLGSSGPTHKGSSHKSNLYQGHTHTMYILCTQWAHTQIYIQKNMYVVHTHKCTLAHKVHSAKYLVVLGKNAIMVIISFLSWVEFFANWMCKGDDDNLKCFLWNVLKCVYWRERWFYSAHTGHATAAIHSQSSATQTH